MEYRKLGGSGLTVSALSLGTATFGGDTSPGSWGDTGVDDALAMLETALDAGINFVDTADIYANGRSEEVLGAAMARGGLRDRLIVGSKVNSRGAGDGPNDLGSSRFHLTASLEASLRRLGTDHLDVYYLHGFDAFTPQEEVLSTLDSFIVSGKVRYIGASNFSGWQLMKSLAVSDRYGWARHVAHQAHYSLAAREFEWELLPLAADQRVGTVVWSALSQSRLTGKGRPGSPIPAGSRLARPGETAPYYDDEAIFEIVDVLEGIGARTGHTISQVALAWVLGRPTVSSIVLGARTHDQLVENLGSLEVELTADDLAALDRVSARRPIYPYWHQQVNNSERIGGPAL